jgi:hypothetical protein
MRVNNRPSAGHSPVQDGMVLGVRFDETYPKKTFPLGRRRSDQAGEARIKAGRNPG